MNLISDGPVFIIGSERSGTNLLRRRITEHQSLLIGPSPIHILKIMRFSEPYYGGFEKEDNLKEAVEDAIGLTKHHFAPWDTDLNCQAVMKEYDRIAGNDRTVVGIMHVVYTLYAESKGYRSYICKDNDLFLFVDPIVNQIQNARFIYIHRDPRDVVVSQRNRITQNPNVVYLSELWRGNQEVCLAQQYWLTKNNLCSTVSYRDLITNEDQVLKKLFRELSLPYNPYPNDSALYNESTDIQEWKNISNKTITNNFDKYLTALTKNQIKLVESICWNQMKALRYNTTCGSRPTLGRWERQVNIGKGKIGRLLRSITSKNRLTAGQKERRNYIKKLRNKIA